MNVGIGGLLKDWDMKNKYLYFAAYFCGAVILLAVLAFEYMQYQQGRNVRGQYTFANTRQHISELARIKIITALDGEINIIREDNVWRFKEANNYFANVEMLSEFYKMINNSIILTVSDKMSPEQIGLAINKDGKPNSGTIVETYDTQGQLLDSLVLADFVDVDDHRYARLTNRPYIYMINGAVRFSGRAETWLPYPLLSIPQNIVEEFVWNGETYNRYYFEKLLQHSAKGRMVMQILRFIEYQGLTTTLDFVKAYPMAKSKKIKVVTIAGLIYNLYVYHAEGTYWLKVTLSSTKVPHKEVIPFIKNNQKYFDKWMFQLNDQQGAMLYRLDLPTVKKKKS